MKAHLNSLCWCIYPAKNYVCKPPQVSTCSFFFRIYMRSLHLFVRKSAHACIHVKNSPQLCRAGTGQRRGFQWYHWGYKWWRCGPNLPASPDLSVWSSGTPPTLRSVTACTNTHTQTSLRLTHLCSLLVVQPEHYVKYAFFSPLSFLGLCVCLF